MPSSWPSSSAYCRSASSARRLVDLRVRDDADRGAGRGRVARHAQVEGIEHQLDRGLDLPVLDLHHEVLRTRCRAPEDEGRLRFGSCGAPARRSPQARRLADRLGELLRGSRCRRRRARPAPSRRPPALSRRSPRSLRGRSRSSRASGARSARCRCPRRCGGCRARRCRARAA